MRPFALTIGTDPLERAVGAVLAHNVPRPEGKGFLARKGQQLRAEDLAALEQAQGFRLHLLEIQAGDLHEEVAGARLAAAVGGPGVRVRGFNGSQFDLVAAHRGLLRVDAERLARVNAQEGVSVFTLFDSVPVDEGQELAGVKVTPYLIAEDVIRRAEDICSGGAPLCVYPFRSLSVGVLIPTRIDAATRSRFEVAMDQKLDWLGNKLGHLLAVDNQIDAYENAFQRLRSAGVDVIMTAGASSIDPLEPLFLSLERAGAVIEKHGVPIDPGSLFWLACLPDGDRRIPVVGLSSCEMFSHKTILDIVLPRVFAGQPIGREYLVSLGHGGLLTREMAWRFPPYGERKDKKSGASGGAPGS